MTVIECPHCGNKELEEFLHLEDCVVCRTISVTEDGTAFVVENGDDYDINVLKQDRSRLQCLACEEEFFAPATLEWGDPRGVTP